MPQCDAHSAWHKHAQVFCMQDRDGCTGLGTVAACVCVDEDNAALSQVRYPSPVTVKPC